MPTYAYRCRDCGHTLEVQQGFSDAALTVCPVCGGVLRKQYGSVGVTFNGSGFYRTDSRAKPAGEGSSSKESGGSSESKGTETKKESAPAKSDAKPASTPAKSGGTAA